MHVCMHAFMYAFMYACMHVCMYACMHTCMYACLHACMHAYTYAHMHLHRTRIDTFPRRSRAEFFLLLAPLLSASFALLLCASLHGGPDRCGLR